MALISLSRIVSYRADRKPDAIAVTHESDSVSWMVLEHRTNRLARAYQALGEHGASLPAGEIGEVFIRPKSGPGSTYHYIGAEAKSMDGGWESLGDIGHAIVDVPQGGVGEAALRAHRTERLES